MLDQLNLKLTASNIRAWTIEAYQRKMIVTQQTFASKMVSVEVEVCEQRKRHLIGINLQAVVDGNLRAITAAVNELHKRTTFVAIGKTIVSCLAKLDILEKQIYSFTTDNGSNDFKVGELIRSDFALSKNFADQNDEDDCN